jgi:hypothetical protein
VTDQPTTIRDEDPLAAIPHPSEVRRLIGMRYAEILILKKLLRAAESRDHLFPVSSGEHELPGVRRV